MPTVTFKDIRQTSYNRVTFTLKAQSGEHGSRDTHSGRKGPYASWHAHGYFFDILFDIDPAIFIRSRGEKITVHEGNWQDINVGSQWSPCYMSELSN